MKYSVEDGFLYYIEMVEKHDFKLVFEAKEAIKICSQFTEQQACFRYAPNKWSIKQMIGHMIDHERIMLYRALRFSRKDATSLPGYDQNFYVENSRFDALSLQELLKDFRNVREASLSFIDTLSKEQLALQGKAWKFELTVEQFLQAIIGHERHHINIIKEKYFDFILIP